MSHKHLKVQVWGWRTTKKIYNLALYGLYDPLGPFIRAWLSSGGFAKLHIFSVLEWPNLNWSSTWEFLACHFLDKNVPTRFTTVKVQLKEIHTHAQVCVYVHRQQMNELRRTKRLLTCFLYTPFQVQQASTGPAKYSGPVDVAKSLYREGGLKSIYKGTCATLLRGKFFVPCRDQGCDVLFCPCTDVLAIQ